MIKSSVPCRTTMRPAPSLDIQVNLSAKYAAALLGCQVKCLAVEPCKGSEEVRQACFLSNTEPRPPGADVSSVQRVSYRWLNPPSTAITCPVMNAGAVRK